MLVLELFSCLFSIAKTSLELPQRQGSVRCNGDCGCFASSMEAPYETYEKENINEKSNIFGRDEVANVRKMVGRSVGLFANKRADEITEDVS